MLDRLQHSLAGDGEVDDRWAALAVGSQSLRKDFLDLLQRVTSESSTTTGAC